MAISWLAPTADIQFPPLTEATEHGLLAAGGDLSAARLLEAYERGIFPWFNQQDPILWWSPDPRMILPTDGMHISKNLNKLLRRQAFDVTFDLAFSEVMEACSKPRSKHASKGHDTWIHEDMIQAYLNLHYRGYAHSVECWQNDQLVGGLYGVAVGKMFFGESMFSFVNDSSKVALVALTQQLSRWHFPIIDCQVHSSHLASLGAKPISRQQFIQQIKPLCAQPAKTGRWQIDKDLPAAL